MMTDFKEKSYITYFLKDLFSHDGPSFFTLVVAVGISGSVWSATFLLSEMYGNGFIKFLGTLWPVIALFMYSLVAVFTEIKHIRHLTREEDRLDKEWREKKSQESTSAKEKNYGN